MTWEERVRHLLRAAKRAAREGDRRVAETLRRMAREAVPVEGRFRPVVLDSPVGCSSE